MENILLRSLLHTHSRQRDTETAVAEHSLLDVARFEDMLHTSRSGPVGTATALAQNGRSRPPQWPHNTTRKRTDEVMPPSRPNTPLLNLVLGDEGCHTFCLGETAYATAHQGNRQEKIPPGHGAHRWTRPGIRQAQIWSSWGFSPPLFAACCLCS